MASPMGLCCKAEGWDVPGYLDRSDLIQESYITKVFIIYKLMAFKFL